MSLDPHLYQLAKFIGDDWAITRPLFEHDSSQLLSLPVGSTLGATLYGAPASPVDLTSSITYSYTDGVVATIVVSHTVTSTLNAATPVHIQVFTLDSMGLKTTMDEFVVSALDPANATGMPDAPHHDCHESFGTSYFQ